MRYLIIDTKDNGVKHLRDIIPGMDKIILSEEGSMAKFKEIWENGGSCYNNCTDEFAPFNDSLYEKLWDALKKTL